MNSKTRLFSLLVIVIVFLSACNLPSRANQGEQLSQTAVAQTVEALLSATPVSGGSATPSFTPLPPFQTITPIPQSVFTNTPIATATANCNVAQFITDVTIPDGTIMTPSQAFTKKWRIKNSGQCAWNGFTLVFDSGDAMGGPATKPIAVLNPGQEVDIEVALTAPATAGNYRGYWRIITNSSVLVPIVNGYQGKSFYVDIKVQNAATATNTLPPAIAQVVLTGLTGEDGFVSSDGSVNANPNAGDTDTNTTTEAFVSFDTSVIPAGATITKVTVDFGGGHDTLGNPWSIADGCLRAYVQNYGTLDAGDFFPGDPTSAVIRWCSSAELSTVFEEAGMKSVVQSIVGSSRLQLRLQFRTPTTNSNGIADMVRLGTVKLIVTYQ